MQKKYDGFYQGYVVQNNDPDGGGKVKILVPALMPTLLSLPEDIDKEGADVKIDFKDFSTIPSQVLERIKRAIPWARQMSPLIGDGSESIYDAANHLTTTVDNPIYRKDFAERLSNGEMPESDPKAPGATLQQSSFILSAGNIKSETDDINNIPATPATDPDNNNLVPDLYSNKAKGMFSVPSVGALVWLFFEQGSPELPVYIGYQYSNAAWKELYGSNDEGKRGKDYPNGHENSKEDNGNLVREKIIFNAKAGSLSFTGTDYFEKISLAHRNGSFTQFDNSGRKDLVVGKSSSSILGDEFQTIRGNAIDRIFKDHNLICDQSSFTRIGSRKYDVYSKAREVILERAEIFSRFRTERTAGPTSSNFVFGAHSANNDLNPRALNPNIYTAQGGYKAAAILNSIKTLTPKEVKEQSKKSDTGLAIPPNTATFDNIKDLGIREKVGLSEGEYNAPITRKRAWTTNEVYSRSASTAGWDTRPAGQTRKSPSTAGGSYNRTEGTAVEEIEQKLIDINQKLDKVLKDAGDGGDKCEEVTKDYFIRVGAVNNDFPAVRVDPIGGIVFAGVVQGVNGPASIYKETNLIEYTGNDSNFPCGNYTISVGNKFAVDAGSGGITFKTTGVAEIAGVATKISALHFLELTTAGSISIDAGKSLCITADILSLRQSKNKQLALGGSVGVENNITVGGSAIVNGELYLQHVTAPAEIQTTDQTRQLRGWTRRESIDYAEPVAAIPEGRIIVKLTKELCYKICRWGGVRIKDSDNDDQYEVLLEEPTEDVQLPAWNDNGVDYGVLPSYVYDENIDEWVEVTGTGFAGTDRSTSEIDPSDNSSSNNDVPLIGTNRVTAIELEAHAHQFKNLPLSLRSTPQDVIAEARDIENYPEVRGLAKGSRPAKILVKGYGESEKHKKLQAYSKATKQALTRNNANAPDISGAGVGNQDDIRPTK